MSLSLNVADQAPLWSLQCPLGARVSARLFAAAPADDARARGFILIGRTRPARSRVHCLGTFAIALFSSALDTPRLQPGPLRAAPLLQSAKNRADKRQTGRANNKQQTSARVAADTSMAALAPPSTASSLRIIARFPGAASVLQDAAKLADTGLAK
jgi:hypothetical protein